MIHLDYRSVPPASGSSPRQLVIMLHGYGSNKDDLISLAPFFASVLPDAQFISPDAPYLCEINPIGRQWFSLQSFTVPYMFEGARQTAPVLDRFIDACLDEFKLPPEKLALVGFSQGTMISLFVALRRKSAIGGVLGYSGALLDQGELDTELNSKPPVCLVHGTMDPVVPYISMQQAEHRLKHLQVPCEAFSRPGLPHTIDSEGIEIGKQFLLRCFR